MKDDSKVRVIRKDIVIGDKYPEPDPEVIKATKWLYEQAQLGSIREIVYCASDTSLDPIFGHYGESVNYTMMYTTIKLAGYMYFESVVIPSMRGDVGELDE